MYLSSKYLTNQAHPTRSTSITLSINKHFIVYKQAFHCRSTINTLTINDHYIVDQQAFHRWSTRFTLLINKHYIVILQAYPARSTLKTKIMSWGNYRSTKGKMFHWERLFTLWSLSLHVLGFAEIVVDEQRCVLLVRFASVTLWHPSCVLFI